MFHGCLWKQERDIRIVTHKGKERMLIFSLVRAKLPGSFPKVYTLGSHLLGEIMGWATENGRRWDMLIP